MPAIPATWLIVGATRGIGFEFVQQILRRGDMVIATARVASQAGDLYLLTQSYPIGQIQLVHCDISTDSSIDAFVKELSYLRFAPKSIDYVIMNAGVLHYPNRTLDMSFSKFDEHMRTNCIGPIITAQKLMRTRIPISMIVFMSSDSASATNFLAHEDGFAAYAASKAALNHALRHMTEELKRTSSLTTIIAMHPGEVSTDMAKIDTTWEIEGVISPAESIAKMIAVITARTAADTGTFWRWDGRVHPW